MKVTPNYKILITSSVYNIREILAGPKPHGNNWPNRYFLWTPPTKLQTHPAHPPTNRTTHTHSPAASCGDLYIGLWADTSLVQVLFTGLATSTFPLVPHDWVIKGLGMSSHVRVTWQIKDPMPPMPSTRVVHHCPGGGFLTWSNNVTKWLPYMIY